VPPQRYVPTELHGVTFRKTVIFEKYEYLTETSEAKVNFFPVLA